MVKRNLYIQVTNQAIVTSHILDVCSIDTSISEYRWISEEHRFPKPFVGGSIPTRGTTKLNFYKMHAFLPQIRHPNPDGETDPPPSPVRQFAELAFCC